MLFADVQEFFGRLFLGAIGTVVIWMWIIQKLGLSGHAKKEASGWLGRLITNLFK